MMDDNSSPTSILVSAPISEPNPTATNTTPAPPATGNCTCHVSPDAADNKFIPIAKIWVNESALGEIVHEFKMRAALREWLTAKGA